MLTDFYGLSANEILSKKKKRVVVKLPTFLKRRHFGYCPVTQQLQYMDKRKARVEEYDIYKMYHSMIEKPDMEGCGTGGREKR